MYLSKIIKFKKRLLNPNRSKGPRLSIGFYLLICVGMLLVIPNITLAEKIYPNCFPIESSWKNVEIKNLSVSDDQISLINQGDHSISVIFNKFHLYRPQFYGFAFLKNEVLNIPRITAPDSFEQQFRQIKLVALLPENNPGDETQSFRFSPSSAGDWVIYLVASQKKIAFLEQKDLRISPEVDNIRGGSVFSGSSLRLVEPIDYKACVIP